MSIIGGPAYGVMFGPGPPRSNETAALDRWKRTTLAYMGARSEQVLARGLGTRYVGLHTRAIYSRLATGDVSTLTSDESIAAYNWGDWAALRPQWWSGPIRCPGEPERDMMFDTAAMRVWPYRFMTAMVSIYGWETLTSTGLFLDADVPEWWKPLRRFAAIAHMECVPAVYLNGGQFRSRAIEELNLFGGLFYEAVHVGKTYEAQSRENAEALLERLKNSSMWVGIQVRFSAEPTAEELSQWSRWFLKVRKSPTQSVTFVVQPGGSQPRELPCPDDLDPARYVQAKAVTGVPRPAPEPQDSEMP